MGSMYMKMNQLENALLHADMVLDLNKNDIKAIFLRADILTRQHKVFLYGIMNN